MANIDASSDGEDRPDLVPVPAELGPNAKAEWVALMAVIGSVRRDLYREIRADAWDSVARLGQRSGNSN